MCRSLSRDQTKVGNARHLPARPDWLTWQYCFPRRDLATERQSHAEFRHHHSKCSSAFPVPKSPSGCQRSISVFGCRLGGSKQSNCVRVCQFRAAHVKAGFTEWCVSAASYAASTKANVFKLSAPEVSASRPFLNASRKCAFACKTAS